WVAGEQHLRDIEAALVAPHPSTRFYVDVGGREEPDNDELQAAYLRDAERVAAALRDSGTPVRYVYDSQAYHFETAWAERLPSALAWLLSGYAVTPPGQVAAAEPGLGKGVRRAARRLGRRFSRCGRGAACGRAAGGDGVGPSRAGRRGCRGRRQGAGLRGPGARSRRWPGRIRGRRPAAHGARSARSAPPSCQS